MELSTPTVRIIHDYELPGKGFLPVKKDDILYVVEADPSGWWLGTNTRGKKGVFPSTYSTPYIAPLPTKGIQTELDLVKLAERFSIDLMGGIPLPTTLSIAICPPALLRFDSLSDVRTQINKSIVSREGLRLALKQLLIDYQKKEATSNSEPIEKPQRKDSVSRRKTALASGESALESAFCTLERERGKLPDHRVPQLSWYRRFVELQDLPHSSLNKSALQLQVSDVQTKIRRKESDLSLLVKRVNKEEKLYLKQKEEVKERIYVRDSLIVNFLNHWDRKAKKSKEMFFSEKDSLSFTSEKKELRRKMEVKRSEYDDLLETYRILKAEAKVVRGALLRREEIKRLEFEINQCNTVLISS